MKRKILIFTLLVATTFVFVPVDSFGYTEQPGKSKHWKGGRWDDDHGRRRRRFKGRNRYYYGYRNYGQYRRTQVGNRRYRLVRRYYWNDGIRLTRWVRLYY